MSHLEDTFSAHWNLLQPDGWPKPLRQFRFAESIGRKFSADFAWPWAKVIVECQGGTFSRGNSGHKGGAAQSKDYKRLNIAQRLGWIVLQYDAKALAKKRIVDTITEVIEVIADRMEAGRALFNRMFGFSKPVSKLELLSLWGSPREEQFHPFVIGLDRRQLVEQVSQTFAFQALERFDLNLDQIGQFQLDINTRV